MLAIFALFTPDAAQEATRDLERQPLFQQLSRDWHQDVVVMVRDRLPKVLIELLFLVILAQVVRFFVRRLNLRAQRQSAILGRAAQLRTMATILRATSFSILGFLAFLQILNLLNIRYEPLLASAGVVAVGIGLAAQSLFKDIINGVFILVEDQYNVGEVIKIAALTGTVEDLTLRLTRLRDGDGTLYIIPNSQIAVVSNLSRDYAQASLTVTVDASANPDDVVRTLKIISSEVRSEPAFKDVFLSDPNVLGVDKMEGRAISYPIIFKVPPNQKDDILREMRRRIIQAFERQGIPFGIDPTMLVTQAKADPTASPAEQPVVKT